LAERVSPEEIHKAWNKYVHGAIWVARPGPIVRLLAASLAALDPLSRTPHRLLLVGKSKPPVNGG
jgi:hypothetical protein